MTNNRKATAYHEAAHAVADERFGFACDHVTIVRNRAKQTLGHSSCLDGVGYRLDEDGVEVLDTKNFDEHITALLAGYAASIEIRVAVGRARGGAADDFLQAKQALLRAGYSANLTQWKRLARRFVRKEWPAIEAVARELLERNTLDGTEVETIMEIADGGGATAEDLVRYRQLKGAA